MTYKELNDLIISAEASGPENFWEYECEFFMLFYNRFSRTPLADIPDVAFMFMEISSWLGMSFRDGVWQYYESGASQKGKFERVISYLKTNVEDEMADIYAHGIHDYDNERYQKSYDYPREWLDDSDDIDKWLMANGKYVFKWMYDLILDHKNEVLKMAENQPGS